MTASFPSTAQLLSAIHEDHTAASTRAPDYEWKRKGFLEAAAVLHLFRPSELRATTVAGDAAAFIIDDAVPAIGWSAEGYWTLVNNARREVLSGIRTVDQLKKLRRLNESAPLTGQQIMLDRWLGGQPIDPSTMSATELSSLRALAEWGLERFPGFPASDAIEPAWRRRALVMDFEKLGEHFVGRQRELAQLHTFVGSEGAGDADQSSHPRAQSGRALILHGSGGVGKSALVARFILDMFDSRSVRQMPFVYLALDDPTLDPAEPRTLIGAAVRQLDMQLESLPPERGASGVLDEVSAELSIGHRTRERAKARGSAASSQRDRLADLRDWDRNLNRAFAQGLRRMSDAFGSGFEMPILFVIDTFEEASYRPEPDLLLLYELLGQLIKTVPGMRLLLAGRAMPEGKAFQRLQAEELALADLSETDAVKLLLDRGLDASMARDAVSSFGRNPLTLRLVAHVLQSTEVERATQRLGAASEEVIRGYLYRRILDHIHDPTVRQLAHPGMVLRRVTPEIIEEVLAPVCGVKFEHPDDSAKLFQQLSREHTLVGRSADGALVYREEIRLPMLKLIEGDAPEQVARLHREAAQFYSRYDDDLSREEQLYHILMGSDPDRAAYSNERFPNRIASRLAAVADELPPKGRLALSQLTRIRLNPADIEHATSEQEANQIAQDVLHAIRFESFERAAALLNRKITPGSPLAPLKVRVLKELGRFGEAEAFASEQIAAFPALGNRVRLAELMWFAAQSSSDNRRAEDWLVRLAPVAERLSPLTLVQTLTELARIASPERRGRVSNQLARALALLPVNTIGREDRLVRLALTRADPGHVELWRRLGPDLLEQLPWSLSERPMEEINKLAVEIAEALKGTTNPELEKIAFVVTEERESSRWPFRLVSLLEPLLRQPKPDPRAIIAARLAFAAEQTSLHGSSLAGLDEYRESWELDSPSESVA